MTDPSTGPSAGSGGASGRSTLEILRRSHRALLDYEAAREARHGPRSEAGRAAVRKVAEAHRETWARAGGKPDEFLLAPLLGNTPAPVAKPKGNEASGQDTAASAEERPRGKSRKEP